MIVNLDQEAWNRVLAILSQARWDVANPLIMEIGDQLRHQAAQGRNSDLAAGAPTPVARPNGEDDGFGLNQAKPQ